MKGDEKFYLANLMFALYYKAKALVSFKCQMQEVEMKTVRSQQNKNISPELFLNLRIM